MKLYFVLFLALIQSFYVFSNDKYALIVAISDYREGSGWTDLSCENDVFYIQNSLLQLGFPEENIYVLRDADATKEGIQKAFKTHLIDKANKGATCYFHFSGHGQQVIDDNDDEIDAWDEALVPYDSNLSYESGINEGEKLIRDDEMGALLNELRKKIGASGHVLALFDSCHSGTATRGLGKCRGTTLKMAPDGYKSSNTKKEVGTLGIETNKDYGSMVCFFAAQPNELNWETTDTEGKGVGSLSYMFSKAVNQLKKDMSYEQLFKEINLRMKRKNIPNSVSIEGEKNLQVLGGKYIGRNDFYSVSSIASKKKIRLEEGDKLLIDGGKLGEIFEGAEVLFLKESTNFNSFAKGIVVEAGFSNSTIQLTEGSGSSIQFLRSFVKLNKKTFPTQISVGLDFVDSQVSTEVQAYISSKAYTNVSENNPDLHVIEFKDETTNYVEICTRTGYTISHIPVKDKARLKYQIDKAIKKQLQYNVLQDLQLTNEAYRIEMTFTRKKDASNVDKAYQVGEFVDIVLSNTSERDLYFALIDLTPDQKIQVVFPNNEDALPEDCFLESGDVFKISNVKITPPTGWDQLKIVGSKNPLQLHNIAGTRDNNSSKLSEFEKLFSTAFGSENTRSASVLDINEVHIEDYFIQIKK